jgi:hypothetical protein
MKNRFRVLRDQVADKTSIQEEYDALLDAITSTAKEVLGTRPRDRRRPWVSEKTRQLLAEKERVHVQLAAKSAEESRKLVRYEMLYDGSHLKPNDR